MSRVVGTVAGARRGGATPGDGGDVPDEVECPECGATQWPTEDCMACGAPLPEDDG